MGWFYGWGMDPVYFLFMIPGLLIVLYAQAKVKSTFAKYNNVPTMQGITGAEAARRILDMNGLHNVPVQQIPGELSDNFDPKSNVVRLSAATYGRATVGAVGVAAHECGHAIQYATGYAPIKLRNAIVPICSIGSGLSVPVIILGFFLSMPSLVTVGIVLFALVVLFQLVTLPVEFNASNRALQTLTQSGMVTPEEGQGVRSVLTAAGLTYVAAMLQSILTLLYYVLRFSGRGRKS